MTVKKRTITNFINNDYKLYAIHTLTSRGIPNFYDSLTPVQRIILLNSPTNTSKTLSVVGNCIADGYHSGNCLHGDTEIILADNTKIKISDWCEKYNDVELIFPCYDEQNKSNTRSIGHSPRIGQITSDYYEIELENGEIIKCTENHPFFIDGEWVEAKNLKENDNIRMFENENKKNNKKI